MPPAGGPRPDGETVEQLAAWLADEIDSAVDEPQPGRVSLRRLNRREYQHAIRDLLAGLVALGPTGLFLGALLDGAGVPVPSGVDVLLVAVASTMPDQILWLAAVTVLGSVIGNLLLFLLARRGGEHGMGPSGGRRGAGRCL